MVLPSGAISSASFTFFSLRETRIGVEIANKRLVLRENAHHFFHLHVQGQYLSVIVTPLLF
jgi:hypothetical protein